MLLFCLSYRIVQYTTDTNQSQLCNFIVRSTITVSLTVNGPQEVVDGRFVEKKDKVEDVVDNQPGHVFCIAQVLTLNTQQPRSATSAITALKLQHF